MNRCLRTIKILVTVLLIALFCLAFGLYLGMTKTANAETDVILLGGESLSDEEITEQWADNSQGQKNLKLMSDWNPTEQLVVSATSNIVLNLNGHKISGADIGNSVFLVNGALEIRDEPETTDGENSVGMITDGISTGDGGGIRIDGGQLKLYGGKITGNSATNGGGVSVYAGKFEMYGGEICGNSATNGGGIYFTGNSLLLYGGTVYGNNATSGGGIYSTGTVNIPQGIEIYENSAVDGGGIWSSGILTLKGGIIGSETDSKGNEATRNGGGIYSLDALYITDGEIVGNSARNGGGIYAAGTTFQMTQGSVNKNSAENGGGVYFEDNFELSGGEVCGNNATNGGGIYSYGEMYLSGAVTVTQNVDTDDIPNNVFIPTGQQLIVNGEMKGSAVGITLEDTNYNNAFTQGYFKYNNSGNAYPDAPENYFISDSDKLYVIINYTLNKDYEVRLYENRLIWQVSYDDGEDKKFEDVDGYGITITYGTMPTAIQVSTGDTVYTVFENDNETEYGVEEYTYNFKDNSGSYISVFTVCVNAVDMADVAVDFSNVTDYKIDETNNSNEFVIISSESSPILDNGELTAEFTQNIERLIKLTYGSFTLEDSTDYDISFDYDDSDKKITITLEGKVNYSGTLELALFIIEKESEYTELIGHDWQYYDGKNWTDTPSFTYSATDLKYNVRVVLHYKRYSAEKPAGESFDEVVTYNSIIEGWNLYLLNEDGQYIDEFRNAGEYTFELAGTYSETKQITIGQAQYTGEMLDQSFATDNDSWLVYIGTTENKTTALLDGNDVYYVTQSGVTQGGAGQAYVYLRSSNGELSALSIKLNYNSEAGSYISNLDGEYVTVTYAEQQITTDDFIQKIITTATLTFANYYFELNDVQTSELQIVKEWYTVKAANRLYTFSEAYNSSQNLPQNNYEWTYGDIHDSGIFSYVFRPSHGEYAFITITGQDYKEQFAVRFTDNVTSFWQYNESYQTGNRILDKFFLYEYLEELDAGSYVINVHIPETSTLNSYKQWWLDDSEVSDYGIIYAQLDFSADITVKQYSLNSTVTLEQQGENYVYSDGDGLNLSYASSMPYSPDNQIPEITLTLNGRTLYEDSDYEIVPLTSDFENNMLRSFEIISTGYGNLTGGIHYAVVGGEQFTGLPYEIIALTNSFETLSIIAWKYLSFDSSINLITAKTAGGEISLSLYANNGVNISDDEKYDAIDLTRLIYNLNKVSTDANGTVQLKPEMIKELENLEAGTYWLRAVATDADGIYETCISDVKFIVLQAENRWLELPGIVSWSFEGYDPIINKIYGTPVYGTASFKIYKLNDDKTYSIVEFNGKTVFGLDDEELMKEVSEVLSTLDSGTYYICASVTGSKNYTGLNEDYTQDDISKFPSFSVFSHNNSWKVLPTAVGWTYGSYSASINVITGTPSYGEAEFSITDSNGEYVLINGEKIFTLTTDGTVPTEVSKVLEKLQSGTYYVKISVEGSVNFTGLEANPSFTVQQVENFWTETPNLLSWKWKEYSQTVNAITASSVSDEAPVVFGITYEQDGKTVALTFNGKETFTFINGKVPDYVHEVLQGLTASITYTLYAYVEETTNYTALGKAYTVFDVIPQTNSWLVTPNIVSWKYGEYNSTANAINARAAYGEVKVTVYSNNNGVYEQVALNKLDTLGAGVYYLCAVVEETQNYTGLNNGEIDFSNLPTFSVASVNNYWRVAPNVVGWKYGEYDPSVNIITATPAFGEVVFSIYEPVLGGYNILSYGGEQTFKLTDGKVPEEVRKVLASLNAGTYYLRPYVAGTQNYTGFNETVDITSLTQFNVISVNNYWLVTPNVVSWRYGEYDSSVNVISATPAYGNVTFTVYRELNGRYVTVDLLAVGIDTLGAGTYYLCATVKGTVNYTGINENITEADIPSLATFSVIKVNNQWEDVPSIIGWSEGHYTPSANFITGSSRHGEVVFIVTDEKGNEYDLTKLSELGIGSYILNAYVAGTDNYFELSASTTFAVFEDSVGLTGIITSTIIFSVLAVGLAVAAIIMLIRRQKKVEQEFLRIIRREIQLDNDYNEHV